MKEFTKVSFTIEGFRPIIMNNGAQCDPKNPQVKHLKGLVASRGKTEAEQDTIALHEFFASLYFTPELGVYLPSDNLQKMFYEAAKLTKQGRRAIAVTATEPVGYPVTFPNSKNIEKMAMNPELRFRRAVVINKARVMKTRALIPTGWTCAVSVDLDTDKGGLEIAQLENIIVNAGYYIGLGDWRPGGKTPGGFGRFRLTHFNGKAVE